MMVSRRPVSDLLVMMHRSLVSDVLVIVPWSPVSEVLVTVPTPVCRLCVSSNGVVGYW